MEIIEEFDETQHEEAWSGHHAAEQEEMTQIEVLGCCTVCQFEYESQDIETYTQQQ